MMFFKKSKQEADILPPPPPFPKLKKLEEIPIKEEVKLKLEKEKRPKTKMDIELAKLEKAMLEAKEKPEIKEKFLKKLPKIKLPKKIFERPLKIKEIPEIKKPLPEPPIKIEKPQIAEKEITKAIESIKKIPKFRLFKPKEKPKIELPEIEELPPPAIEEPRDEVMAIKHKIHEARNALMDFDLAKAKLIYTKIIRMYDTLSPEKQAIVYEQIRDLYDERKSAESLKIKA